MVVASPNQKFYSPNIANIPAPTTKADWAYALLVSLGIDPSKNPNSVAALIAQQNVEGTTGSLFNNPLAVTAPLFTGATRVPGNSAGVIHYATWQDGVTANAVFMTSYDPQLVRALAANSTPSQYGAVLQNSNWEGLGGNTYGPNVSYGKAVAGASSSGGFSTAYQKIVGQALQSTYNAASLAGTDAKGNPLPDAGAAIPQGPTLPSIASWLGFGSWNWTVIGGMALAIGLILVGIYVMFHSEINSSVKTGLKAAAA
jgi:hypothetical protein